MGGNTLKGWCVVFDHNKISVVKPNEEGNYYNHVSSTTRQVVYVMLFDTSREIEYKEKGENNV